MLFNSIEFILFFLPITLVAFYTLGRLGYNHLALIALIFASLFFYGWWNPSYLGLLIFSILFNYGLGSLMGSRPDSSQQKAWILRLGIVINLALIGYFKYRNFFLDTLSAFLGFDLEFSSILLPLAISFFTFQQISYLIDVYHSKIKSHGFLKYCLFVSFFPQLIAGPIVHYKDVEVQFSERKIGFLRADNIAIGITIFIIGLTKKLVVADYVAQYSAPVFNAALDQIPLTFYEAWSGTLFYGFQLYFDFSGYSDMALGCARMFGVILPLNFYSPYKASDISDFWRRWHITLSNFLRDYLYIPLGGNRNGALRQKANLLITMLLGGLWHGAGWTFIFWGGLHGLYLVIHQQWRSLRQQSRDTIQRNQLWGRLVSSGITFFLVMLAWVFFRAETMESAFSIVSSMLGFHGFSLGVSIVPSRKRLVVAMCLLVWLFPNTQDLMDAYKPALISVKRSLSKSYKLRNACRWQPNMHTAILSGASLFLLVKILFEAPESEFLYFNF